MVGAGANDIGGINFSVSNASKLLDEAREQAIADARRKAEIYAKAAGVTLGAPISISEEGAPGPISSRKMSSHGGSPVAQGEETLQVTVTVSWAIKRRGSTLSCQSSASSWERVEARRNDDCRPLRKPLPGCFATLSAAGRAKSPTPVPA